ncbi:MAG: winged helix-turn-helix transcriptional regulator [Anaerolineae bacterium]|nr:winged helix-turn-helix transcriptional regulator [Anaerolineae bacterium]
MVDTRHAVLDHIRVNGQSTVQSLAEALGISPISVRHHLTSLQAEGLIRVELDRQRVGRPKHIYSLTERVEPTLPNQYHTLALRLLDELKASLSPTQVTAIIDRIAATVAARYGDPQVGGTLEQRLTHLVDVLGAEGFMAEVSHVDDQLVLMSSNCPYTSIGQHHPEVCQIDTALIRTMLGVSVEQTSCVLHGDRNCAFVVQE